MSHEAPTVEDPLSVALRTVLAQLWAGYAPQTISLASEGPISEADLQRALAQLHYDLKWRTVLAKLDSKPPKGGELGSKYLNRIDPQVLSEQILPMYRAQVENSSIWRRLARRLSEYWRFGLLRGIETEQKNKAVQGMRFVSRHQLSYGATYGLAQDQIVYADAADLSFLSRCQGVSLRLNGLRILEAEAARHLGAFKGFALHLNGLMALDELSAAHLAAFQGTLSLNGLVYLSEKALAALAVHQGPLCLRHLQFYSERMAQILASSSAQSIEIGGHLELSQRGIQAFSAFQGRLTLGLRDIDIAVAKVLSNYAAKALHMTGLTSLSPSCAQHLALYKGQGLWLDQLSTVAPQTMAQLAQFKGRILSLGGLKILELESAQQLASFKGHRIRLNGLSNLTPDIVLALAAFQGQIVFHPDIERLFECMRVSMM